MSNERYVVHRSFVSTVAILILASLPTTAQSRAEPTAKRIVAIEYPWLARMAVLQGKVELVATISQNGNVQKVRVVSGPELLAQPSREALAKWQFTGCQTQSGCDLPFVITYSLLGSCDASEHCPSEFEIDLPNKIGVKSKSIHAIVN